MISSYVHLLRPQQWIKNLLLLFPPFFAGQLFESAILTSIVPALMSFSLAASSNYIINDIKDIEWDKHHDNKKLRGIASGVVPIPIAAVIAFSLYILSMLIASSISRRFEWFLIIYYMVSLTYTFFLKDVVLIDIFIIAFGFIIRVLAGGDAFGIVVSNWLFLTVFTVSLLLAAGKRLGELILLRDDARYHRKIFSYYSRSFLEGVLWFSASTALVTYALYTLEHKNGLFFSVPLAAFGLLRYIYLVKEGKGDPTEALLMDGQITGVGVLWAMMIGIIIYYK